MIGKYKLKEDSRFRCGLTSFGLSAGRIVEVKQVDKEYRKVLIVFSSGLVDWYADSMLDMFEKL